MIATKCPAKETRCPAAATSWTTAPDAKSFTFKLNPAAVFNSGNPLTSADVKFSYGRLHNLQGPPSSLADKGSGIQLHGFARLGNLVDHLLGRV